LLELEFANVQELRQYPHLPSRDIRFSDLRTGRRIVIGSGKLRHFRADVSATAETESWCGGAVEAVFSFVKTNKLWYAWFLSPPVFWMLILILTIAPMLFLIAYDNPPVATAIIPKGVIIGWLAVFIVFSLIFFNERLLPAAVICISDSEGFVRKYVAELTLAIMAVSVGHLEKYPLMV
jgi:hypothetical protein